jgi:hypothetical protein
MAVKKLGDSTWAIIEEDQNGNTDISKLEA